jgi:hypothetical protein
MRFDFPNRKPAVGIVLVGRIGELPCLDVDLEAQRRNLDVSIQDQL